MLTGLEEKILQCITRYITQNGRSPTLDEIGQLLEIKSKGTIHRYVKSLIDKGHLQRSGRNWRGLRLTGEKNRRLTILPLAVRIAAGKPIEAISEQNSSSEILKDLTNHLFFTSSEDKEHFDWINENINNVTQVNSVTTRTKVFDKISEMHENTYLFL